MHTTEVTVTSPAIVALNHLLRNQLALTRQFIATSRHATEQFSSGIVPDHHYTTLEETKDVRVTLVTTSIVYSDMVECIICTCNLWVK